MEHCQVCNTTADHQSACDRKDCPVRCSSRNDELTDIMLQLDSGMQQAMEHSCECGTEEGELRCKHCGYWVRAMSQAERRLKALLSVPSEKKTIFYRRCSGLDKRIAHGDDYAGDAWVRWTAVGQKPEDASDDSTTV